jgi:putative transposase
VLEISRGWFYGFLTGQFARSQRQSDHEAQDLVLLPKIKAFFKASKKCYGSKRIHQDLLADGETVSERRVVRIMKQNKVSPRLNKRRKPVTTDSNHKMRPSIARQAISRGNQPKGSKPLGAGVPLRDTQCRLAR